MIVTSVHVKNFGPHEDLFLDTAASVVAILGPNGGGKTRILRAIDFAFSGELDVKNQQDAVRVGAVDKKGEPVTNGSVCVTFRKDGNEGEIFRQIGTSPRRHLKWDGEVIKKEVDIQRVLKEVLNCDKRAISLAVFLTQGKIGDFLFLTPAEREKEFTRMCLIDHLNKVGDLVDQETLNVRKLITDHGSKMDEVEGQLRDAEAVAHLASVRVSECSDHGATISWAEAVTKARYDLDTQQAEVQVAVGSLRDAEAKVGSLKLPDGLTPEDDLEALRTKLENARAANVKITTLRQNLEQVNGALALAASFQAKVVETMPVALEIGQIDNRLAALQQVHAAHVNLENAQKVLSAHAEAAASAEGEVNSLKGLIADTEAKVKELEKDPAIVEGRDVVLGLTGKASAIEKILEAVGAQDGCTCPACKTGTISAESLRQEAAALRQEVTSRSAALGAWSEAQAALTSARTALETRSARLTEFSARAAEAETSLKAAQDAVAAVGPYDPQEAAQLNQRRAELSSVISTSKLNAEAAERERTRAAQLAPAGAATLEAEIKGLEESALSPEAISVLSAQVSALVVYARQAEALNQEVAAAKALLSKARSDAMLKTQRVEELQNAQPKEVTELGKSVPEALEYFRQKQAERSRLQGEMDQATKVVRRLEQRREEIRKLMDAQAGIRSLITKLERIKALFSRGGIQRKYLVEMFGALATLTAENLSHWESDFVVREDPDNVCNFLFCRLKEPDVWMDQAQLSGGQRIRLSLSFLLAVQQIVFPDINFMVLDEPSVHLDTEGVKDLGNMFQTLASRMENQESQVIVVDHHADLRSSFQKVIQLAG